MNWIIALLLCFVFWSTYAIPGNFAEKTHGVSVNMFFETLAFILVTTLLGSKIIEGLPKVTFNSAVLGSLMGLGSAVGFYFFLTALSLAPNPKSAVLVVLVAGVTFPIQSALFSFFGEALTLRQWFAILGMGSSIALYNWNWK